MLWSFLLCAVVLAVDVPEFLQPVLPYVFYFGLLCVLLALAWGVKQLTPVLVAWVQAHVKNATLQKLMLTVIQHGAAAILAVDATFVNVLKAQAPDGKLSPADAQTAEGKAIQAIKDSIGADFLATLEAQLGSPAAVDATLTNTVKALVEVKNGASTATPEQLAAKLTAFAQGK